MGQEKDQQRPGVDQRERGIWQSTEDFQDSENTDTEMIRCMLLYVTLNLQNIQPVERQENSVYVKDVHLCARF